MTEKTNELPKSSDKMNPEDFIKLYKLTKKQNWLEDIYGALIELWNLCGHDNEQNLIYELLWRFSCLDLKKINNYCKDISKHVCDEWSINSESTKIVALCDEERPDGSQFFIQILKNKFADRNNWTEINFENNLTSIGKASYQLKNGQNLILIDDFIGTGNTVKRKIKWLKSKIKEKNKYDIKIFLVSLACMRDALYIIKSLKIKFFAPVILKKGISDYYKGEILKNNIGNMKNLESKLHPIYKNGRLLDFNFGYGKAESLFAIEGINVPNNVFPIFWWPLLIEERERNTILKRIR
ncbi:hypothetical protein KAH94_04235 [bacterium]|nr:hypothetical protein [bacterium]